MIAGRFTPAKQYDSVVLTYHYEDTPRIHG